MAEIVNLRRARKAKARAEAGAQAEANRAKHGVSKPVRDLAKARNRQAEEKITSHKLNNS